MFSNVFCVCAFPFLFMALHFNHQHSFLRGGWSGGAMVLGKLPVSGRPTIWVTVGQGVSADGGCLDIFTLIYPFSPLSPSLWETVRYRLKYCLKGPLNQKQPTNQFIFTQDPNKNPYKAFGVCTCKNGTRDQYFAYGSSYKEEPLFCNLFLQLPVTTKKHYFLTSNKTMTLPNKHL